MVEEGYQHDAACGAWRTITDGGKRWLDPSSMHLDMMYKMVINHTYRKTIYKQCLQYYDEHIKEKRKRNERHGWSTHDVLKLDQSSHMIGYSG